MSGYQSYGPMPGGAPYIVSGRPEHPRAMTVLVLGILSLVGLGFLGPFAWYMGNKAQKECAAGLYALTDPLRIGRILGMVGTGLLIVTPVMVVVMIGLGLGFAATL